MTLCCVRLTLCCVCVSLSAMSASHSLLCLCLTLRYVCVSLSAMSVSHSAESASHSLCLRLTLCCVCVSLSAVSASHSLLSASHSLLCLRLTLCCVCVSLSAVSAHSIPFLKSYPPPVPLPTFIQLGGVVWGTKTILSGNDFCQATAVARQPSLPPPPSLSLLEGEKDCACWCVFGV